MEHSEPYIDGYLRSNLQIAKEVITKDWDMIFIVDGAEGSGKSVCCMRMASFCVDNSLVLEHITFTPNEFKLAIKNAKKYSSVIYDEGFSGLQSRATMSRINRALVSMLAEIRQKNLFVFVVVPTFFDLDKYVALWRSRALIHVYTGENFQRGFFAFYSAEKKKMLYINGKKTYSYKHPAPDFIGRFVNWYPVNEKDYRTKKLKALNERAEKEIREDALNEAMDLLFTKLQENANLTHEDRAEILGIPISTYYYKLRAFNEE